jgi:hypothetical protein
MEFYEKAAAFCVFGRGCTMALTWMTATPAWRMWNERKKKKKSKEQSMWDKLTASTAREFMTKVRLGDLGEAVRAVLLIRDTFLTFWLSEALRTSRQLVARPGLSLSIP